MTKAIVIPSLLDTLPFHDALSWEKFQALCTDTLYKTANAVDSREYLSKGNVQHGIDVYATGPDSNKKIVAQCKLKDYVSPKQVLEIVDEFLKGNFASDTSEFILCTSADLGRQRDEEETIAEARKKLSPFGIQFSVWDQRGLSRELRTDAPSMINIVYRYFGEDIAAAFFGKIWENYIARIIPFKKNSYRLNEDHIERSIISYEERIKSGEEDDFFYWHGQKQNLVSLIDEGAQSTKQFVLLSTAGFGKTEELRFLAGYFSQETKLHFPFHFYLRDYEGQSIEDLLDNFEQHWRNIADEHLLLVLDGIDEIVEVYAGSFINRLNAFVSLHPLSNIVVSSRYNFYNVRGNDLRGFKIYLLNPLRYYDIENYLDKQLGERKQEFKTLLEEKGFNDFLSNPYYLTRLVQFFKNGKSSFPRNKTEFFQKTLFEKIEKDEDRYRVAELKEQLLPVAQQIAFCMTLSGKSSLTDEELKELVSDEEIRKNLKHFSIFNRNSAGLGTWTFEHKNLQEYLCASVFVNRSFAEVHSIISFEKDPRKLLPRFLNTLSFLFELIDKNGSLFLELFNWINSNEPELLVRFEKEQLSPNTRKEIFEKIFYSYKEKGFTLRISPHLSNREVSFFIDINEGIIEFLGKELNTCLPQALAYDAVELVSKHKRPFLLQQQIEEILLQVLNNPVYETFVKAKAIQAFPKMNLASKGIFEKILQAKVDFNDFEIRYACIVFLSEVDFAEDYIGFILNSIMLFESGQRKEGKLAGADDILKHLLLSFNKPTSVKKILQYCIWDKNTISHYHYYREFSFEFSQAKKLLEKATEVYKQDPSILRVVYRLYLTLEYLSVWNEWFTIFKNFFDQTSGINAIFQKLYCYGKRSRSIMSFADAKAVEFLTQEYLEGKIENEQMTIYQNNLSWTDNPLFKSWNANLNELTGNKFVYSDLDVNYPEINKLQEKKNQQMLLDKRLFLEEANTLFNIIAKDKISQTDLWMLTRTDLRRYSASIVLDAIRTECRHDREKVISRQAFLKRCEPQAAWDSFVVTKVEHWLKEKEPRPILPQLLNKVEHWCISKIAELDFEDSVRDKENPGSFTMNNHKNDVKNLFLLLKIDIDDQLLLKMLPIDYNTFLGNEESIGSLIVQKVKDRELLKTTVLQNIRGGNLASIVLGSHFKICHDLNCTDCLPYLYKAVIENSMFNDYDRVKLTNHYLDLGGEISDFAMHLTIPEETQTSRYASWHWLLIEKYIDVDPKKIIVMLQCILNDENQTTNKIKASEYLVRLSVVDGLEYWAQLVIAEREVYDRRWLNFQESIALMPAEQTINIFFSVLENNYNEILGPKHHSREINEVVFTSLVTIAKKDYANYLAIKNRIISMMAKLNGRPNTDSLTIFSERLTQQYLESKIQEMDITSANLLYHQFTIEGNLTQNKN